MRLPGGTQRTIEQALRRVLELWGRFTGNKRLQRARQGQGGLREVTREAKEGVRDTAAQIRSRSGGQDPPPRGGPGGI